MAIATVATATILIALGTARDIAISKKKNTGGTLCVTGNADSL